MAADPTASVLLPVADLPESVWKQVLQHLPTHERLTSCCLVSQKLRHAALAATDQLTWTVPADKPFVQAGLTQWLSGTPVQLTSLLLSAARMPPLRSLHCPCLRQLVLEQCSLQASDMLQGLAHLTHLSLQFCIITDGLEGLAAVAPLPRLQHLVLGALSDAQQQGLRQLDAQDLLPRLPQLTHLELSKRLLLSARSMQHLSCLAGLRTLILHCRSSNDVSTAAFGALQHCQHLQRLELSHPGTPVSPSTAPFLAHATALLQLKLAHGVLQVPALAALAQLQQLELSHVQLLPGALALLDLLPALQQLQHLRLGFMQCNWPSACAAYSALAASSKLRHLDLSGSKLPQGSWQHVFPSSQQLPQLSSLLLGQVLWGAQEQPSMMHTADLAHVAECCPQLQELQLWRQLHADAELPDSRQLAALTRVWLVDVQQGALGSLAQLTGLRDVYVLLAGATPSSQLQQLTAPRQLTRLMVHVRGQPNKQCVAT